MTRSLLTLTLASLLMTGCARATLTALPTSAPKTSAEATDIKDKVENEKTDADKAAKVDEPAAEDPKVEAAAEPARAERDLGAPETKGRAVGDFIVYRFSGSFRKTPLLLSERVIDKKGSVITVDITADDDGSKQELRVRIDEGAGSSNEVISVARLAGGVEKPATIEDYEALMAETVLSADENEAVLEREDLTLDLGGSPLPCKKTSYRVRIGKKHATLRTLESEGFVWGDVGGEITSASGKILYRAEIVDLGHAAAKGNAVAVH